MGWWNLPECAKFRGSRAIVGLVGFVPSCPRAFAGISWVQNFVSWVFRGSKIFFSWVFQGSKNFFSWVLFGSEFFSRE